MLRLLRYIPALLAVIGAVRKARSTNTAKTGQPTRNKAKSKH